jgi:hypothetical protein
MPDGVLIEDGSRLMFRTGVYSAAHYSRMELSPLLDHGVSLQQNVTGFPAASVSVFHSNFSFFAGAAAVELSTVIVIMYTFYGFWRLGRNATLSPLEIAKVRQTSPR